MQDYNDLHDIAAEASIISTLVFHAEFIVHSEFLQPSMFSEIGNSCYYWAIQQMVKKGILNIDNINLTNQLQSNNAIWQKVKRNGYDGLKEFLDNSKYAARDELAEYVELCKTVCSYAYKREVYKFSQELERRSLDENIGIAELDASTHEKFSDMTEKFIIQEDLSSVGKATENNLRQIIERQGSTSVSALPSKFKAFVPYFAYKKTRLIVFEGRQKSCKSMILLNEAIYAAQNGVPTLYIDSEISDEDYSNRLLANISGVEFRRIDLANDLTEEELNKLSQATETIKNMPLYHYYLPTTDLDHVYSLVRTMQARYGIQLLVYDYIKGREPDMGRLSNTLGKIADVLKNDCGGKCRLPVIAAAQIGRSGEVFGSDQINMAVNTAIKIEVKTPDEIMADGGPEYGYLRAKIVLNRDGGNTSDEWISLGAELDKCRIFDCPQPTGQRPFEDD